MFDVLPGPVQTLFDVLRAAGHEAVLVGGCVRDRVRGADVHDFDVATSARSAELLALFPRAVPIGLRFGTVMVPTAAGPVDITRYRGATLLDDLARRDFTLNAIAYDPQQRRVIDPHGGLADLAAGRLRAVGRPEQRLAEDPLRALRAARIAAELSLEIDPALEAALPSQAAALAGVAAERIGGELLRLLASEQPGPGLSLLRRSGLEAVLVPGAREDAQRVIAALPPDLTLRIAAWLRGCAVASVLARWRASRTRRLEVETLLSLHPVDAAAGESDAGARRLRKRAGSELQLERALALREAECRAGCVPDPEHTRARLAALRERLVRTEAQAVARAELAFSGQQVMECLGWPPGPRVGEALAHLLECVLEDASQNTPERLREVLLRWAARSGPAAAG